MKTQGSRKKKISSQHLFSTLLVSPLLQALRMQMEPNINWLTRSHLCSHSETPSASRYILKAALQPAAAILTQNRPGSASPAQIVLLLIHVCSRQTLGEERHGCPEKDNPAHVQGSALDASETYWLPPGEVENSLVYAKGQQTSPAKGQIVDIFDFVGHRILITTTLSLQAA